MTYLLSTNTKLAKLHKVGLNINLTWTMLDLSIQLLIPMLQDDNFSLSLLNELSVKYGIQTHLSHAPLPQKLEELREYLRREIKKELKVIL